MRVIRIYMEFEQNRRIGGRTEIELDNFSWSSAQNRYGSSYPATANGDASFQILEQPGVVNELYQFVKSGRHLNKVWIRFDKRSGNVISTVSKFELVDIVFTSYQVGAIGEGLLTSLTLDYKQSILRYVSPELSRQ